MNEKILVINPGSTSTKIAAYDGEQVIFNETLRHNAEELQKLGKIADQKDYRRKLVEEAVHEHGFNLEDFAAFSCRGGLIRQMPSGTYRVSGQVVEDSIAGASRSALYSFAATSSTTDLTSIFSSRLSSS